jgi:hypothetical protein
MEDGSVKVLIIGGDRHGEWVDGLPDGVQVWVDIRNAANHRIRKITQGVTNRDTGEVLESYVTYLAVHEALIGPDEPMHVQTTLVDLAMNEFARAHGKRQEIPKELHKSQLSIPDQRSDHRS